MARYIGPKNKLARAVGEDLGLKSNTLKSSKRIGIRPGQHGAKGRRKLSEYGLQLREKQKLKRMYGILEKQLYLLYQEAASRETATGPTLLTLLERRLDNVVYRLGWAPTRAAARQLVSHGHVLVDQQKIKIPSYRVRSGSVVVLSKIAAKIPAVEQMIKDSQPHGEWLQRKANLGKIERLPIRSDIQEAIEEQLVIEYYSR